MRTTLLLLVVGPALAACTPPDGSACLAGVRESFSSTLDTVAGNSHTVETTQCVSAKWTFTECSDGGPHCWWMFEPNTPAKVPLELIFGDFVFKHQVGDRNDPLVGGFLAAGELQAGMRDFAEARVAEGYFASPVQPFTLFDQPAYEVSVSCDHPDVDPICPFTWRYVIIDLDAKGDGLYADFSIQYADFVDAGNVAAPLPEEFEDYELMFDSIELTVDGA